MANESRPNPYLYLHFSMLDLSVVSLTTGVVADAFYTCAGMHQNAHTNSWFKASKTSARVLRGELGVSVKGKIMMMTR